MNDQEISRIIEAMQRWESLVEQLPPDRLVSWARAVGTFLAQQGVSTGYLHKVLAKLIKAEHRCRADLLRARQTRVYEDLLFLEPRLTYKVARTGARQARSGYQALLGVYAALIQANRLHTPSPGVLLPELRKLREFFQAVISYHELQEQVKEARDSAAGEPVGDGRDEDEC